MFEQFWPTLLSYPPYYFYISALLFAVLLLVLRLTYLEMPRVTLTFKQEYPFVMEDSLNNGDLRRRYLVKIKNIGLKNFRDSCLLKITKLEDREGIGKYGFIPIALRTEHQAGEQRSGRFNLSSDESKMIEIVSLIETQKNNEIVIHYEYGPNGNSQPSTLPRDRCYLMDIQAVGCGPSVKMMLQFYVGTDGKLVLSKRPKKLNILGWKILMEKI